jgi:hypothetical protein
VGHAEEISLTGNVVLHTSMEVLLSKFQMPSCFSHLAHPLAYLAVPDPFLWEGIQQFPKEAPKHDYVSTATTVVFLTTQQSPIECYIQTVMTNMNSHGHDMYLPILIKCCHFALKCYCI